MEKILGIDTGTNSLGWAIVSSDGQGAYKLLEHGTNIFQEGVKIEKGIESSKASERTVHRGVRKRYWRLKVRKIRLLTVLRENNLCPPVSKEELRNWRLKSVYPQNELFLSWQRTEDKEQANPYHYRYLCLTQKLDLTNPIQRYILGRALYHLNQRRGFLTNRKEETKESDGAVIQGISQLVEDMKAAGCKYLGEYFYSLYQKGQKIRTHYTARKEHYLNEFKAICAKQELDESLIEKLEKAIFFQRPLKSQKQQVGRCTFEPKKARCSISHPLYEDFRMYSFINNIRIETPNDAELRPLTFEEKQQIIPLFIRKSKRNFPFEDIAKKLAGKNKYCYYQDKTEKPYRFNYHMDTTVSTSLVNAQLTAIFGENWLDAICETYTLAGNKSRMEILNDIWHALFSFDDTDKLKQFAMSRLQLNEKEAADFAAIRMPQEYASLSLKAICKILPYLKNYGLIYSEAVFLANLCEVIPSHLWQTKEYRATIIESVIDVMHDERALQDGTTTEQRVKDFLKEKYRVTDESLKLLYHPSMLDAYPRQRPNDEGVYQLGSPRINSVRNPMAMHSLFRLRKVVNQLLKEGKIDENTTIHIELSRDLNDANRRKAIQADQRRNEADREKARKRIEEHFLEHGINRAPSDTDILKYQLWEEQNHKCVYTGDEISLADFLDSNPKYDIEHTIPRSAGGDSTKMNLTLCQSRYNREIKKTFLPTQLAAHEEILQRIEGWREKYEKLDKQIRAKKGGSFSTKEAKDRNIQSRHELMLQRDYWRGKYKRFTMTEVPEGFSRRQGTDNSVISRYARLYLRSVFRHVYIVKGIATSDFRKIWGIQDEYTKKVRVNHVHHCIDAITVACIGLHEYAQLAQFYHQLDDFTLGRNAHKPQFDKPWPTFVDDMKHIQDDLLIAHYTQDNMPKAARRHIMTPQGKILAKGDVARGSLHKDTFYGAISVDDKIRYVIRKGLSSITEKDVANIVDEEVKSKVYEAITTYGTLVKAIEADGIWMNHEKGIRIKKVRLFADDVVRPIHIRAQRDISSKEYKRQFHVKNDENYMMAIYIGADSKGKQKREFEIVNRLSASNYYRKSNGPDFDDTIVPIRSKNGYELAYQIKIGTMVLLYDESPEEIWELDTKSLQRRLYKVTGLSSLAISSYVYGTIVLTYHQEARPSKEVPAKNGIFVRNEILRPTIKMYHTQFNALINGVDFIINELGEVKRLK